MPTIQVYTYQYIFICLCKPCACADFLGVSDRAGVGQDNNYYVVRSRGYRKYHCRGLSFADKSYFRAVQCNMLECRIVAAFCALPVRQRNFCPHFLALQSHQLHAPLSTLRAISASYAFAPACQAGFLHVASHAAQTWQARQFNAGLCVCMHTHCVHQHAAQRCTCHCLHLMH